MGQLIAVILVVSISASFLVWQGVRSLAGKRSKLGSCCSKGCGAETPAKSSTERVVFLPVEMLRRKK
jgi:hypothetical protein